MSKGLAPQEKLLDFPQHYVIQRIVIMARLTMVSDLLSLTRVLGEGKFSQLVVFLLERQLETRPRTAPKY